MTDLQRIEQKLDRLLHILEKGNKSFDLQEEAKKVVEMKFKKRTIRDVGPKKG